MQDVRRRAGVIAQVRGRPTPRIGAWGAVVGLILLSTVSNAAGPGMGTGLNRDSEVQQFVEEMVREHGFQREELESLLTVVSILPEVLAAIARPAEVRPWHQYRAIFLTPARIEAGARFLRENAAVLARAEDHYGVPAEIVAAIIGVETRYGARTGSFRVLDALVTLAFRYPRRSRFFRRELMEFLLLAREEGLEPQKVQGSYAGAVGFPQFIASSYRRYAVDFDGDGRRDLFSSMVDAIGSVAHYLRMHGWESGGPIAELARIDGDVTVGLISRDGKPVAPLAELQARGLRVELTWPGTRRTALLELESGTGSEYWVVAQNFYVITRYNHSVHYAMAVYQLAQAIREHVSLPGDS
jgi:membrane-bound lytic murein transglycosylase B